MEYTSVAFSLSWDKSVFVDKVISLKNSESCSWAKKS